MSDTAGSGMERVTCPDCGTSTLKETMEEAIETAEDHDEKRHDGERTAKVNGILPPSNEVVEAAKDALQKIRNSDTGTSQEDADGV